MGCRLGNFETKEWKATRRGGHLVETATATTVGVGPKLKGALLKVDGRFKGFIGTVEAALEWADEIIATEQYTTKLDGPATVVVTRQSDGATIAFAFDEVREANPKMEHTTRNVRRAAVEMAKKCDPCNWG
jgi:hypothetical protein